VAKKGSVAAATGDVLLWLQLIEHSASSQKPVILVTDERGEDWWWKSKGRTLGPLPELVAEMRSRAKALFYLYSPDEFLRRAIERSGVHVEDLDAAADETRQVSDSVRSHQDSRHERKIADRIVWVQRQIDEADERQAHLISELRTVSTDIDRYSNLPPEYENSPIGDKVERRKWAAERAREKIQRQIDEIQSHRETLRHELAFIEDELSELSKRSGHVE
jgi:chromosome segregation ATPase